MATVVPSKRGAWMFSQRVITLMPWAKPEIPGAKTVTHSTKRNVAAAVARFARYPSWLMKGDPAAVVKILNARSGYRL